ncbi:GH23543 [Drosophila grimshawi]|uniref:GH23543 n=1 Tax=Drosophila grimshawi TaxID=7222 RepID=B4JZW9_DROGR|nr:GH23543 [Drosophila grimshawi]
MMQTQGAQREDLTAVVAELKSQIFQLNDTVLHLENLLWKRDEEEEKKKEKATSSCCSVLDPVGSVQLISVPGIEPRWVLCDACGAGTGWIVIQHRFDGSLNFYRDWNAYRNGFGFYNGEFFIGLELLHRLTKSRPFELYVELVDFNNHMFHAQYDSFLVGSEEEKYMLKSLGTYTGNAGDSLKYNLYDKFSTYDNDNDGWSRGNCANYYASGWWFNWDANSNLNGRYFKSGEQNVKGIWLYTLKRYYSLKSVKMLIRPKYTLF